MKEDPWYFNGEKVAALFASVVVLAACVLILAVTFSAAAWLFKAVVF